MHALGIKGGGGGVPLGSHKERKSYLTRFTLMSNKRQLLRPKPPTHPLLAEGVKSLGQESPARPPPQAGRGLATLPGSARPEGRGRGSREGKARGVGRRKGKLTELYPPRQESPLRPPAANGPPVPTGGSRSWGGPSSKLEMPTPLCGRAPAWDKEKEVSWSPLLASSSRPRSPEPGNLSASGRKETLSAARPGPGPGPALDPGKPPSRPRHREVTLPPYKAPPSFPPPPFSQLTPRPGFPY